jgi:hypothetical protein
MAQGSEKTRRSHHWLPEPKMLRLDKAVSMVSETSEAYHQVFKGEQLNPNNNIYIYTYVYICRCTYMYIQRFAAYKSIFSQIQMTSG